MPERISVLDLAQRNGYNTIEEFLTAYMDESVWPACCDEECSVEPDGTCQHGHPSPLLALGMI